ncbi:alpha/beta fold hydrolase [Pseudoxanthomonas sp. SGD-10]|uniref:alpha/beta hydrolase family protein n=1 Tax=unclassified Pseudoxanthomonas TaxID=2645906 RepID=UPI000318C622|nr:MULTISPECIES: alpha/beta fold hydrolase [unclassified Pseudoxanthomonas]RRN80490.1 alpha/beta fold hydrolase [Pseudoxanthomonas sp. SGD-10]
MSEPTTVEQVLAAADGHRWTLARVAPPQPRARLLWLPALGVAARHYLPLAAALAAHGIAVHLHEWRGNGSSSLRPSRERDWGYAELLSRDLPASLDAVPGDAPLWLGGHSLGGQLACCLAGLHPQRIAGLALVASGTPYWRSFPAPRRWLLPLAYRLLPWLARRQGVLHGRRLGFGGTEARGLIADWAAVGRSGRYAAAGTTLDLEAGMAALQLPVQAVVLADDWLGPASSLHGLLAHLPRAQAGIVVLDQQQLQVRADHFSWMRSPGTVASTLAEKIFDQTQKRC